MYLSGGRLWLVTRDQEPLGSLCLFPAHLQGILLHSVALAGGEEVKCGFLSNGCGFLVGLMRTF